MYWGTGGSSLPSGRERGRGGAAEVGGTGPAPCVLSSDPPSPGGSRQRRYRLAVRAGFGVRTVQRLLPLHVIRGPVCIGVVVDRRLGRGGAGRGVDPGRPPELRPPAGQVQPYGQGLDAVGA